jgi:hypothetical protein
MKRLVETDRWKDAWFIDLHPNAKLLLSYLYDNCDESGFIDLNYSLWVTQLKMNKEDIITSLKLLQPALLSDKKKKLFIIDFLKHQKKLPLTKGVEESDWIINKLKSNLEKFESNAPIKNILDNHIEALGKTTKSGSSQKRVFVASNPPTFEILKAYYIKMKPDAKEEHIHDIYDHYVGCGWTVGKNKPMVDWEACVRKAIRTQIEREAAGGRGYNINNGNKKSRTETTLSVVDELKKNN